MSRWRWIPKWLKFRVPTHEEIRTNRYLRLFGPVLESGYLWHFHRRNVSKAIAIGVFCACLPMPFQMIPACAIAIYWRAHLPIAIALVWLSNPLTMPFILIGQYHLGANILGSPSLNLSFNQGIAVVASQFTVIWKPLLLGALIMACVLAFCVYFTAKYLWARWIVRRWRHKGHIWPIKRYEKV